MTGAGMTGTGLEFGCAVLPSTRPAELRTACAAADELGYDRMWVPDQEFYADPFLLLHDLTTRTTMDLGLALTSPFSRHPVQIARAMASLIHLDGRDRRWVLGLGVGNSDLVLGPLGLRTGATARRLVGSVELVRRLLQGDTVDADPDGFVTSPVSLDIEPTSCRVYVGSRGPQTLAGATPVADGIITESLFTADLIRWIRAHTGISANTPHIAWQSVLLLEPGQPLPDRARRFAAMLVRTTAPAVRELMGLSETVREHARSDTLLPEHLSDDDVRGLVAVGSPAQIRSRVLEATRAGVTGWSCVFLGSTAEAMRTMRAFAEEVMIPARRELGMPPDRCEAGEERRPGQAE